MIIAPVWAEADVKTIELIDVGDGITQSNPEHNTGHSFIHSLVYHDVTNIKTGRGVQGNIGPRPARREIYRSGLRVVAAVGDPSLHERWRKEPNACQKLGCGGKQRFDSVPILCSRLCVCFILVF